LSQGAYKKIFKDESKEEVEEIVEKTLEMYFEKINRFYKILPGSIIRTKNVSRK